MILNKFRPSLLTGALKAFSLLLLILSLFSCSKTASSSENKAYIGLTHVAYGTGPLNITLDGDSLIPVPVSFGYTSGMPGNPYDTATSRISEMQLVQGTDILLHGNSAFQQGSYYSIFAYDTLDIQTIGILILQNDLFSKSDTTVTARFLNFSPSSKIGIMLIYAHDSTIHDTIHIVVRDTIKIGPSFFVGYNPNPAAYPFSYFPHVGTNQVFAYIDSASPRSDSSNFRRLGTLQFESTKSYNLYLQNFFYPDPSQDSLQIKSDLLN
jgi:hypothetical protein